MRWECLSVALDAEASQQEASKAVPRFGVFGGMAPGERREFVKFIKADVGRLWRETIDDLDYLEDKAKEFFFVRRIEAEDRAEAKRKKKEAARKAKAPNVVPISIATGRGRRGGARPVPQRNRDRSVGRANPAAPPKARVRGGAQPKAAQAGRVAAGSRKVRGKR